MRTTGDVVSRRSRRVTLAVVAITVLGLLARLAFLGDRIAHWDEARVGYWILEYAETGTFEYRPIIHGPFLHHVNAPLFDLLGPNDVTMRLAVSLLGAALPLVALLVLADHRLFLNRAFDRPWRSALRRYATRVRRGLRTWTPHFLVGVIEFLAVVVFFYSPRGTDDPGFDTLLADPTTLPAVVGEA
ncbi:MAG: TIGR03663 family protein, partial [Halobacteriales archaeon SW_9_67_24]